MKNTLRCLPHTHTPTHIHSHIYTYTPIVHKHPQYSKHLHIKYCVVSNVTHGKNSGGYFLTHGYQVHLDNQNSASCNNGTNGHKKEPTRCNPMGGSVFGKPIRWSGEDSTRKNNYLVANSTSYRYLPPPLNSHSSLDSGCNQHVATTKTPLNNKSTYTKSTVQVTNGTKMRSSHLGNIKIDDVSKKSKTIHFYLNATISLTSLIQLYDDGWTWQLTKDQAILSKGKKCSSLQIMIPLHVYG